MTIEQLKADHPELVEAITAAATAGHAESLVAAKEAGAQAERDRINGVRAQAIPGHESLIEQLAFDGTSTAADAALAIVEAEKTARTQAAAALDAAAPPAVPMIDDAPQQHQITRKEFDALNQDNRRAFLSSGGKITD